MTWFKIDDSFGDNTKIVAAGNEAVGLYVRCGAYAARHLTNGHIPQHVALLYGSPELIETLVRVKLWRRMRGGWLMPDYLDYNPSKEAVENERKLRAERQKRWRENQSRRVTDASRDASVAGAPARPGPYVSTGSYQRAGPRYPQPDLPPSNGSAATRQPPPFAQAVAAALNPEPWDAFTKEAQ